MLLFPSSSDSDNVSNTSTNLVVPDSGLHIETTVAVNVEDVWESGRVDGTPAAAIEDVWEYGSVDGTPAAAIEDVWVSGSDQCGDGTPASPPDVIQPAASIAEAPASPVEDISAFDSPAGDIRDIAEKWISGSDDDASKSPVPTTHETDSCMQTTLTVCELPQINLNKVQQTELEGGGRALTPPTSSENVNVAPDIIMASNLDLDDGGEQFASGPNPAEVVLEKSSDVSTRKGKRKMIDRGDDTTPVGNEECKRNRITTVAEEDSESDIEYIGSWRPRTKNITVKLENVPIKLENTPDSDSDVSAKSA
jgi:hypothetical protein